MSFVALLKLSIRLDLVVAILDEVSHFILLDDEQHFKTTKHWLQLLECEVRFKT